MESGIKNTARMEGKGLIMETFDNVMVRLIGTRCIVSTVGRPFMTGYWPDIGVVFRELGLKQTSVSSLENRDVQNRFLSALADTVSGVAAFKPATIGFKWSAADLRSRERLRAAHTSATFFGNCSGKVITAALSALARQLGDKNSVIDVQFKQWDPFADWQIGKERLNDVFNSFNSTEQRLGSVLLFSNFQETPGQLWEYIFDRPQVRIGWIANELAACSDLAQLERCRRENPALKNLEAVANTGLWPHIILPATRANTKILPSLVTALAEITRCGTIEIIPARLMPEGGADPLFSVEEYVTALLAIYKDDRIPLRMVAPQLWIAERIDRDDPLPSSLQSAGASIAVMANGDMYPGEASVGLDAWRIGNILEEGDVLRWERLDAIPEVFSSSIVPSQCRSCEWRYRCGGVDCSISLLNQRQSGQPADWESLFQLYCAPRKVLFEEAIWDSVANSVQAGKARPRELIECHQTGVDLRAAPLPGKNQKQ